MSSGTGLLARFAARLALLERRELAIHTATDGKLVLLGRLGPNARNLWSIVVSEHRRCHEHAVVLVSPICRQHEGDAAYLLRRAASLGTASVALVDTCYVVRYSVLASHVETAPLERIILYVRAVAYALASDLSSTAAARDRA